MESNYWDKKAVNYDRHLKKSEKAYLKIIELLKEDLGGKQTVLDVGTGTGEIPIAISGHVSKIFATDYSLHMINIANAKIEKSGIGNIVFQMQDCYKLNYDEQKFDVIIASNLIHLLERPKYFLALVKRFLKKDGKLILPTFLHDENIKTKLISKILNLKSHHTVTKFNTESLIELITESGYHLERSVFIKNIMPMLYVVAKK